jgi:hypothetical protein
VQVDDGVVRAEERSREEGERHVGWGWFDFLDGERIDPERGVLCMVILGCSGIVEVILLGIAMSERKRRVVFAPLRWFAFTAVLRSSRFLRGGEGSISELARQEC